MEVWDAILYLNFTMGILAVYYYAKLKGEIFIGDLIGVFFIALFGGFTFWIYFYDTYSIPIHKGLDSLRTFGKRPIWRSRATIAKEVLYGEGDRDG